jgi:hypothetical protein
MENVGYPDMEATFFRDGTKMHWAPEKGKMEIKPSSGMSSYVVLREFS